MKSKEEEWIKSRKITELTSYIIRVMITNINFIKDVVGQWQISHFSFEI